MSFEALNILDYILIAIAFLVGIGGAIVGLIDILSTFIAYLVAFPIAFAFTRLLADYLISFGLTQVASSLISYIAIYLIGFVLVKFLGSIVQTIGDIVNIGFIDSILGFALSISVALSIEALIVYFLAKSPAYDLSYLINNSFINNNILVRISTFASDTLFKYLP